MTYIKIDNERTAFFDVDETLISWEPINGTEPLLLTSPQGSHNVYPMQKNIDLISEIRAVGWSIIIWSQGGVSHAQRTVELLQIGHLVDLIISKPTIYVDDLPFEAQMIKRVYKK